eukprot:TRINITY_DN4148_c3_g1_i1.p1 TRINITY_DN4148_c3_g1~~TRINITY_DN4148_c3_g1_i1.p1  ORF type:complete len:458 (+),score=82.75 TRINITY_DN4148_c3_g1_i1:102-1475(+)
MPTGPASARAAEEWAKLNAVTGKVGNDGIFAAGEKTEAPLDLGAEVMSGDVSKVGKVNLIIVGAGLSGCVLAERCAKELGLSSLIIDKRDHIGGNCYDKLHESGIRVSQYGPHFFHTIHERVWEYVTQFSEWVPFEYRGRGLVKDINGEEQLVPIPPTIDTVNLLFKTDIKNEEEMLAWYETQRVKPPSGEAQNGKEAALSRVGKDLYEKIFRHYTKKQWDKYPEELDASVLIRLPCRTSKDDRYFSDKYQALPLRGYTRIFENILLTGACKDKVSIRLNCDFFKVRDQLPEHDLIVYTGPIDSYYADQGLPKLEYRTVVFETEYSENPEGGFTQEPLACNYPGPSPAWTRIVEYKHTPNQPEEVLNGSVKGSIIYKEFSSATGDPYYPVPNPANRELYEKYRALAEKEPGVAFVGRLASYKYFNMDQAILNALEMYDNLKEEGKLTPKRSPAEMQA